MHHTINNTCLSPKLWGCLRSSHDHVKKTGFADLVIKAASVVGCLCCEGIPRGQEYLLLWCVWWPWSRWRQSLQWACRQTALLFDELCCLWGNRKASRCQMLLLCYPSQQLNQSSSRTNNSAMMSISRHSCLLMSKALVDSLFRIKLIDFGNSWQPALQTGDYKEAFASQMAAFNKHLVSLPYIRSELSGSTAITALLENNGRLTVANVGDSRCIVGRVQDGRIQVVRLSTDHTPDVPEEASRILSKQVCLWNVKNIFFCYLSDESLLGRRSDLPWAAGKVDTCESIDIDSRENRSLYIPAARCKLQGRSSEYALNRPLALEMLCNVF